MIKKIELLKNQNKNLIAAVEYLDFVIGGMYDLQIIISTDLNNQLKSLIIQGGRLDEVNKERTENGLHKLTSLNNERIISKDWIELIESGEGLVVCFLIDHLRQKNHKRFESAINLVQERFPEMAFYLNKGIKGDYFLIYNIEAKQKKAAKTTKKSTKKNTKQEKEVVS